MRVHITPVSSNVKTGKIPVTTTERLSCPTTCKFYDKGCYAKSGPLALHWRKVSNGERGTDWQGLCDFVDKLPTNQLWRHNQAGDLPHVLGMIDDDKLFQLVSSNKGKRGFTYTHHKLGKFNLDAIRKANNHGFTINISTESLEDAVFNFKRGLPTVVVVPSDHTDSITKHDGVNVVVCPAQTQDNITCEKCGLCSQSTRKCIVAFKAHGTARKHVSSIVSSTKVSQ